MKRIEESDQNPLPFKTHVVQFCLVVVAAVCGLILFRAAIQPLVREQQTSKRRAQRCETLTNALAHGEVDIDLGQGLHYLKTTPLLKADGPSNLNKKVIVLIDLSIDMQIPDADFGPLQDMTHIRRKGMTNGALVVFDEEPAKIAHK